MGKLNRKELSQFNEFLLKQIYLTNRKMIQPLYRGDNLENLHYKLGVFYSKTETGHQELLKRLFMVGEKSKHFYSQEYFKSSKGSTMGIDECNKIVFDYIFDNVNNSIKSKNSYTINFFERNPLFKNYFLDKKNNKRMFSLSVLSANQNEQIFFKNYYLSLLHQLAGINYKNQSHFVSASTDFAVAQDFSGNKSSSKGIIIHAWKPTSKKIACRFEKYNLPKYISVPYRNQKEFSSLAGILPHYIIGLEILNDHKLFINPNIFTNPVSDNLFIDGLNINQEDFGEVLKETNYRASFEISDGKVYERS